MRNTSLLLLLLAANISAERQTVCLNMIVKNESPVIERCLSTVKDKIDYWIIVDTGSTDGTQAIIRNFLKDIPGELHEQPWVDFGTNRNQALQLAKGKGDYILFIDADEKLVYSQTEWPALTKDCYVATVRDNFVGKANAGMRALLIRGDLDWSWQGKMHEYLSLIPAPKIAHLPGAAVLADTEDGNRSQDPQKHYKDVARLEHGLKTDPANKNRYLFYLGQTLEEAGEKMRAFDAYSKRLELGGAAGELYWSCYRMGVILEETKGDGDTIENYFSNALQFLPKRAEPLYRLGHRALEKGNAIVGYFFLKSAHAVPTPTDCAAPFEIWIYEYGILQDLAASALQIGSVLEAYSLTQKLLAQSNLAQEVRSAAESTLQAIYRELFRSPFH